MIFDLLQNNQLVFTLYLLLALMLAISFHEFAHAWLADRYGDPTPREAGRVTLNPLAHLDPLGTLMLIFFRFGWGKPVPVNSRNFSNPLVDEIQVSLAGPLANLILALIAGLTVRFLSLPADLAVFLVILTQINLVLMTFNLLPIPPLDGSRILRLFIPASAYLFLEQFGVFFLLIIFLLGSDLFFRLYQITVIPLSQLILGASL